MAGRPKAGKSLKRVASEDSGEAGREEGADRADADESRSTYRSRVHWFLVVAVSMVTILAGLAGWLLRPQDTPPAVRAANLRLSFTLSPLPTHLEVNETILMTVPPYRLETFTVSFSGDIPPKKIMHWQLDALNFDGYPCLGSGFQMTKSQARVQGQITPASLTTFKGVTSGSSNGQVDVFLNMCWQNNPIALVSRPFLAATFPSLTVLPPPSQPFINWPVSASQWLQFNDFGLASYTLQVGQPPTSIAANLWQWNTTTTSGQDIGPDVVYAANLFELQQDNHNVFLSGILLGIAGAALIVVLQELLGAVRRRDDPD